MRERRGGMAGPVENPAEFLLARTGELRLTDAQVTRLAAIARRADDRRRTMRESLDSLRPEGRARMGPGAMPGARPGATPGAQRGRMRGAMPDSATREQFRARAEQMRTQMRPIMEKLREQSRADRRDAIAVLTPDQQADAWEQIATEGRRGPRRR